MRSITKLFGALGTLADSVLALASVIDTATAKLGCSWPARPSRRRCCTAMSSTPPRRRGRVLASRASRWRGRWKADEVLGND